MKITHISTDDYSGGAARAAFRLHTAMLATNVDSRMRVLEHKTANVKVDAGKGPRTFSRKVIDKLQIKLNEIRARNWKTGNPVLHSFGYESARIVGGLNQSAANVLNLHWTSKLLSIKDIGELRKPIVWTLHDMWAFCGGEHYVEDLADARYLQGYTINNRPPHESGPDLNKQTWDEKRIEWAQQSFHIVTPSRWLADCVRQSILFRDAPVSVIPNPIDTGIQWRPISKLAARALLGLDPNKRYVLSGSGGGNPKLKGDDFLHQAMHRVAQKAGERVQLLVFGQCCPPQYENLAYKTHWLGSVKDDFAMATIYSAADLMVVPSRQDNLPNTAVEANACETPVVAFNIGGLPDIVEHKVSGWLAKPFEVDDLAAGILWLLDDQARLNAFSKAARDNIEKKFSPKVVVDQYLRVYEEAMRRQVL